MSFSGHAAYAIQKRLFKEHLTTLTNLFNNSPFGIFLIGFRTKWYCFSSRVKKTGCFSRPYRLNYGSTKCCAAQVRAGSPALL